MSNTITIKIPVYSSIFDNNGKLMYFNRLLSTYCKIMTVIGSLMYKVNGKF